MMMERGPPHPPLLVTVKSLINWSSLTERTPFTTVKEKKQP